MSVVIPPPTPFIKSSGISSILGSKATSFLTGFGGFNPISSIGGQILGNIAGGLFGNDGPSFRTQLNDSRTAQHKLIQGEIASKIKAAKDNKIHPLTILGAPLTTGAPVFNSNKSDNMGQNIASSLAKGISDRLSPEAKTQRELDALALERARLENDLLKSQITRINEPSTGTRTTDPDILPHKRVTNELPYSDFKNSGDTGIASGKPPATIAYDTGAGTAVELPYSEEGPSEALESLPFGFNHAKFAEIMIKRGFAKSKIQWHWKRYKDAERKLRNKTALKDIKRATRKIFNSKFK